MAASCSACPDYPIQPGKSRAYELHVKHNHCQTAIVVTNSKKAGAGTEIGRSVRPAIDKEISCIFNDFSAVSWRAVEGHLVRKHSMSQDNFSTKYELFPPTAGVSIITSPEPSHPSPAAGVSVSASLEPSHPPELSHKETSTMVDILQRFQDEIDEKDEDRQEVVDAVQKVVHKLKGMRHIPSSDADILSLTNANIKVHSLKLISAKEEEIRKLGGKLGVALSLEETRRFIAQIRKYVSFETEAGCRFLINAILTHVVSNLRTSALGAAIVPEFRIPETSLETGASSYGGAVDYLMAFGEQWAIDLLVRSPKLAFTDNDIYKSLSCNIYEAKPDNVLKALPQAVIAAVAQAQRFGFQTFRGCITTGEEWLFFVYNQNTSGSGGVVSWLSQIRLESDLRGLTLVLGLLRDWIQNGQIKKMKFCTYVGPPDALQSNSIAVSRLVRDVVLNSPALRL